ncbi:MAG: response regulator transcription factor [Acidobacteria bacterium]|nr:response regulator transcription factor [Acidobacteriota bacterium]MBI3422269.1 response regulator transcription factor [Acidobacteriota bacterium]
MAVPSPAAIHPPVHSSVSAQSASNGAYLRLLLVSDAPERLRRLAAALGFAGVTITVADSADIAAPAFGDEHDLAIIDVGPSLLASILQTLRETPGHAAIPVLVEASRLADADTIAGLLPAQRAMPCSLAELVQLTRGCLMRAQLRRNAAVRDVEQLPL